MKWYVRSRLRKRVSIVTNRQSDTRKYTVHKIFIQNSPMPTKSHNRHTIISINKVILTIIPAIFLLAVTWCQNSNTWTGEALFFDQTRWSDWSQVTQISWPFDSYSDCVDRWKWYSRETLSTYKCATNCSKKEKPSIDRQCEEIKIVSNNRWKLYTWDKQ